MFNLCFSSIKPTACSPKLATNKQEDTGNNGIQQRTTNTSLMGYFFVIDRKSLDIVSEGQYLTIVILLEVLLKPGDPYCGHFVSVSQSVTPPVLTRGGFNPPKANPRHKHESWDTPKANRRSPKPI